MATDIKAAKSIDPSHIVFTGTPSAGTSTLLVRLLSGVFHQVEGVGNLPPLLDNTPSAEQSVPGKGGVGAGNS